MKFLLALFLVFLSNSVFAERYALLVGVSEYDDPSINLEGPENDVNALRKQLIHKWDFANKNIKTLKNSEATRQQIINSLKQFSEQLKSDDYFVFFFSGHGTSRYDSCNETKLPQDSGALVVHDTKANGGMFITKNDLRPYISIMDNKGINGLGLIDACFSGNSYRSLRYSQSGKPKFSYRYVKLPQQKSSYRSSANQCQNNATDDMDNEILSYPYKNFVFMTASSAHEKALDLDYNLREHSYGKIPHGAFTSSILYTLDSNKQLSHESFFVNVEQRMSAIPGINHSPLLFPEEDIAYENNQQLFPADQLYKKSLFDNNKVAESAVPPSINNQVIKLVVDVPGQYQILQETVKQTKGLVLKNDSNFRTADYIISKGVQDPQQLILTDIHNIPLFVTHSTSIHDAENKMAEILKQQFWLSQFRKSTNPDQTFDLRITTAKGNAKKYTTALPKKCKPYQANNNARAENQIVNETFIECDVLRLKVKLGQKAYLVVLDLTANGEFSLLYPYSKRDSKQITPSKPFGFDNVVGEPFGTDSIVAFAFKSDKDPLYKKIENKWHRTKNSAIKPGSSLHQAIVKRFMTPDTRHAQHIKNIITIRK